ncbi:MAG: monofunctional biosynthetic peptidoglycan transglycosylase [Candidatus Kapabacteria bacterium]|jgi:monofunctional biosynthetic peptidoglycan transglycosylase|nr:monofunctional biosynthetic peptidoglycan transglycosylase [Candidatus Kapabacteria bacterium]
MLKKTLLIISRIIVSFLLASVLAVAIYSVINPPLTPVMIANSVSAIFSDKNIIPEKQWTAYEDISANFFHAVLAAEDARFMRHQGFDWKAIEHARRYNERHAGKRKHGASTVTMQTAKNTFLLHHRNYIRKGLEAWFTVLMEALWEKRRILEVYANVIEFGDGLYGVEAASRKYFKKSAKKLSRRQASLLAAVLPNPHRWSPAKPSKYILRRAATIRARMNSVPIPK